VEQVFRRCRLEGVGQVAIARELGVSLSSVEKDLQKASRALAQLRAGSMRNDLMRNDGRAP
jgi:RNA polymerase sigma-70 factor (ECF subfamily)